MYVADILRMKGDNVISLNAGENVKAAVKLMADHQIGAVLIRDAIGGIAGILSERDVVRALSQHGDDMLKKPVAELMTAEVVTCSPRDPVAGIMAMMTAHRFRHVPVVEQGQIVGMISIGDVVKNRIEEAQAEVDALRRYIAL